MQLLALSRCESTEAVFGVHQSFVVKREGASIVHIEHPLHNSLHYPIQPRQIYGIRKPLPENDPCFGPPLDGSCGTKKRTPETSLFGQLKGSQY